MPSLAQLLLDDVLGGDARVVGAGHPERRLAEHAVEADEDVLEGVLEPVAHVQDARDVRGRDYDDEGLLPGPPGGLEQSLGHPSRVNAVFEALGIVGFLKLDRFHRGILRRAALLPAPRPAARRSA